MNFKQLSYFQDIVRTGSFTEAAEENFISQSVMSQQMKSLEEELGVILFERKNRGFHLTRAGKFFYQKSQRLLEDYNVLVADTQVLIGTQPVSMRIGLLWRMKESVLPQILAEFKERFPSVQLEITVGSHEEIGTALRQQKLDMTISDQRKSFSGNYANICLTSFPLYIRVGHAHPLSQLKSVQMKDLQVYPALLLAVKGQEKIESDYYRDNLGFQSEFNFAYSPEEAALQLMVSTAYFPFEKMTTKATSNLYCEYCEFPLLQNQQPIERDYFLFYHLERAHPYTEDFLEIAKRYFR